MHGHGRRVAVLAAMLALAGSCKDENRSAPNTEALEIQAGSVAIPPRTLDGQDLTILKPADSRLGAEGFRGPIVVSRTERGVIAASLIDEDAAATMGFPNLRDASELGPMIDGVQSWITTGFGPFSMPSLMFAPTPDALVQIASRELSFEQLADVAEDVTLPLEGVGAVPGDVLGALSGTFQLDLPGAVNAQYQAEGRGMYVSVMVATRAQQDALVALTYDDPKASIDEMTESSCCSDQVMVPPRQRTVRGTQATIATLTPHSVVLVLDGDPGLVIITSPPQAGGGIPVDDQLVALAEQVRAGTQRELDQLIQAIADDEGTRQAVRIERREAELGWSVLAEHRTNETVALITTGDSSRPNLDFNGPAVCAVLDSSNPPPCLASGPSDAPIALASPGVDTFFGAIGEDVERVDLVFPGGTRPTSIYDLDVPAGLPKRVFIATLKLDEQSKLTDNFNAAADAVIVAHDNSGAELARVPMYEHLQP